MIDKRKPNINWISTPIKQLFIFVLGGDWGKDPLKFEDPEFEPALCIRGSEIKNWNRKKSTTAVIRLIKKASLEKRALKEGDILIEISGGGPEQPVGRTIYIDEDSLNNENDIPSVCTNFLRLMRFHPSLNSKFIQFYLKLFYDSGAIIKYQGGSNNLRNLKFKDFETINIPLAPRPEQDRIVAKVDILMAQVATMQKSLARIPQLLKDFRQQVLTQAVTGKLTEEWREGRELDDWKKSTLIELIKAKPRNGFSPRGVSYVTEVKSLSLGATTSGKFDSRKVKYLDIEKPASDSHLWLKHGDILIQRSNSLEYVGTSAIYNGKDDEFIYPDIMMKVQSKKDVSNKFLNYCLSSSSTKEYFKSNATGTAGNMPKINQPIVSNTPIRKPPYLEQLEIVRQVESLFAKSDAIEQHYETLKTKIETLPQAILHKAFKGELVEQLPSDGDAKALLREIEGLKLKK